MVKIITSLLIFSVSFIVIAKRPSWINDIEAVCSDLKELCAVGEGAGAMLAESNARNQLGKIFKIEIKSTTTINKESHQEERSNGVVTGESSEDVYGEIQEVTDQVLKGVIIKKTYEGSDGYFALASLDKRKASDRLSRELKEIDDHCVSLYKDGRRSSLNKILKKLNVRKLIHERYAFLSNREYPPRISLQKVLAKKSEKRALATVILINVKDMSGDDELKNFIINLLLENDYRVVEKSSLPHKFTVHVTLSSEKQHMNVKGFEKHEFVLNIQALNSKNEKIGSLKFNTEQVGRDFRKSYSLAINKIKKHLRDNLNELSID